MFYPDFKTACIYTKEYSHIPIYAQLAYDGCDIVSIYAAFRGPYSFLLESGDQTYDGRYSIIALPCTQHFKGYENETILFQQGINKHRKENPMDRLKKFMDRKSPIYPNLPVFTGGAIGHFNYDVIRLYEQLPNYEKDSLHLPLLQFAFADDLIVIDHKDCTITFISNMGQEQSLESAYDNAIQHIQTMMKSYQNITPYTPANTHNDSVLSSNYTKSEFMNMVQKAKEYIHNGDVFQVVLSQRMQADYHQDPLTAYVRMRQSGPSPYMYYLDFEDYIVAGVSPELLLQQRGDFISTMPIAGTRKRGKSRSEDEQLAQELSNDPKEVAEHMMLVDLSRNDIGKVAKIGSVSVKALKQIKMYSHVMHMTSEVHGVLAPSKTIFDALGSVLPAGTLSGAPKIRAMEIIEELEQTKREIYGGAIGFLGYNGKFDTCITIRTMIFHQDKVYAQAGAGIVKDSIPEKEYQETMQKAAVLLSAIGKEIPL